MEANNNEYLYVDQNTIERKGKLITKIFYKPFLAPIIIGACGVALFFLQNIFAMVLGIFFVGISLCVQFLVEDYLVAEIYDDALLVYHWKQHNLAFYAPFEKIAEWNVNKTKKYALFVKMDNGQSLTAETFQVAKADKALRKLLRGKETSEIKAAENRKKKLVFRNPFKKGKKVNNNIMDIKKQYFELVKDHIREAYDSQSDKMAEISKMFGDCMRNKGVVQLFGTNHGQEFVNELNFRAGGLAPYHGINVMDLVLNDMAKRDVIDSGEVYNDLTYLPKLLSLYKLDDRDMWVLISARGNEPIVVELALKAKEKGQKVVAVVNKKSYDGAETLHESGKKLLDVCDAWLDMTADEPDLAVVVNGKPVGQISSTVANVIAQMLTADCYNDFVSNGLEAPVLLSANLKGADVHNNALTDVYEGRVR